MRYKRRHINLERRKFRLINPSTDKIGGKEPDILQIWEFHRRMREREAQLEREYEQTKARLREVKIKIKQQRNMLADASDLQITLSEQIGQFWQDRRLWLLKSRRQLKLKAEIIYIKLRYRLRLAKPLPLSYKKEKIAMALSIPLLLGIVAFSAFWPAKSTPSPTKVAGAGSSGVSAIPMNQTPEFAVLIPDGKDVAALGGFAKISPPDSEAVYAYTDQIDGIGIRVSQQLAPSSIKSNEDGLEKLAQDFNANRNLDIDGLKVYIGQSASGPQSLLFVKNDLLVLISSNSAIADRSWVRYINKLNSS